MVTKKPGRNDTRPAARKPMADPKDKGMTAQEAAERFCTHWTGLGTVSDDPEEREQALGDATSELSAMVRHEIPDQPPRTTKQVTPQGDRVRRRAKKALEGIKKPRPEKRKKAVFKAMMTARQNPDQSPVPVPLWATGRKVPVDPSKPREPIPTDMWEFLVLDIEGKRAAGEGLEYCDLRFFNAEPQAAELPEPADPKSSAVCPNRRGRKKGAGGYDSTDLPLVKEMHRLITSGEATGRYPAMLEVVNKAEGKTSVINKGKRLLRKYATEYGPDEGLSD